MRQYKLKHNGKEETLVIKVVENEEERLKAFVVRAIVYMHEQDCPYVEEFDLNDFASTQVIGLLDGEPILTARIRYFGRFAKLERLAIRDKQRGRGFGHLLLQYLLGLCQEKGFTDFYLHAQKRLESFYTQYGFTRVGSCFEFSDHEYVEMYASLRTKPGNVGASRDPMVINRPEGRWDEVGPLEVPLRKIEHAVHLEVV